LEEFLPELPEAETMARDLANIMVGRTIKDVLVAYPPIVASDRRTFAARLIGQTVTGTGRLGKWLRLELDSGGALLVHLKMTGQFILDHWPGSLDGPWPAHAHAAFLTNDPQKTLFYRDTRKFGKLRAFSAEELGEFLSQLNLGPDALLIDPEQFYQRISSRRGRLKAVLLDQAVVAGLGNIYADECLFAAGLSPLGEARAITREQAFILHAQINRILSEAIELRGSTVNNYLSLERPGTYQSRHQVYGKAGSLCPRCQTPLLRSTVGGRTTISCPVCQK
jgi:formamidopyrimidine-DNA glycosylase